MESIIDGMHKGVFRSDTPMNSHRKHKQHHSNYNSNNKDEFNRKIFSNHSTNNMSSSSLPFLMKKIRVDESGIEIPNSNVVQHMTAPMPSINSSINIEKRNKRMKMNNHFVDHCPQEFWSETVIPGNLQFTRRWSYSNDDVKNKTVSFRCV